MALLCSGDHEADFCRASSITLLLLGGWEDGATGPLLLGIREADGMERLVALVDGERVDASAVPAYEPTAQTLLIDTDGDVLELRIAQSLEEFRFGHSLPPAVSVHIHTGARYADVVRLLDKIRAHLEEALERGERELDWYIFRHDQLGDDWPS